MIHENDGAAPSPDAHDKRLPATVLQKRYWSQAKIASDGAFLNVAMRWEIQGYISDAAVETALQKLIQRHEILRTGFVEVDGQLHQDIADAVPFRVAQIDLQRLDEAAGRAEAEAIGRDEATVAFDLSRHGLIRALLIRRSPDRAILHITLHHLIIDGWSIGVLIREFGRIAAAHDAATAPELDEVDLHFADYALWQEECRNAGAFRNDLEYWRGTLEGLAAFYVPPDNATGTNTGHPSAICSLTLERALTDRLQATAARQAATMFPVAFASLASTLHAITDAEEVVIGTQAAGRLDTDAEAVVGPLLNTLVLRVPVRASTPFSELVRETGARLHAAMAHQRLPYDELATALGHRAEDGDLYRVNFVLQKAYIDTDSVADEVYGRFRIVSLPSHPTGAIWDLNFFMVERVDGWRLSCEFNTSLYTADTVEAILHLWKSTLENADVAFDAPLSRLSKPRPEIRRPVPPAMLAPPRSLSGAIAAPRTNRRAARLRERIICLQEGQGETPVMALNIASVLFPVAQALGDARPFFDIRLPPSTEPQPLEPRAFADLARDAVEMIRLARPRGPYILFGLCVCGAVAIEAARQLREAGEIVELVVLNDTWRPGYREDLTLIERERRLWRVRRQRWELDMNRVRAGERSFASVLGDSPTLRRVGFPIIAAAFGWIDITQTHALEKLEVRWFANYLAASQARFRPHPYDGSVLVFRSEEVLTGRFFPRDLGWAPLITGRLEVVDCPGMHATMFREAGARVIAQAITSSLVHHREL